MKKKYINLSFATILLGMMSWLTACEEPEALTPNVGETGSRATYFSRFQFVNASPDAPALSFRVNNVEIANLPFAASKPAYDSVRITASGVFANTNIRAKAATGAIGGILASNDLILRASSTNTNNFQAENAARYTVFAVDTINRPRPVRTLNDKNFGDVTYVNLTTGKLLSVVEAAPIIAGNNNSVPAYLVSIGTVPLGSTDPGGIRFYLLRDIFATLTSSQAGVRFLHLSPNAPAVWVRATPVEGAPISLGTSVTYAMRTTGGLNPSVGSRFAINTTGNASLVIPFTAIPAGEYTVEVSTNANFAPANIVVSTKLTLNARTNYTIYAKGLVGGTGEKALGAGVVVHKDKP